MAFVRFGLCQPIRRQLVVHAVTRPQFLLTGSLLSVNLPRPAVPPLCTSNEVRLNRPSVPR